MMTYHADANNEPAKEVRSWNGIPLNITTKTGEPRFSFSPPMSCDYGCIRGSWGAGLDGKALDVYVVSDAPTVFKVVQITPAGAIDEYKYVLGAQNFDEAVETFLKHVPRQLFGAASQYSIAQLQDDIAQQSKVKRDAGELAEFVTNLELLIESDDAYGSNVYVLSFEVADNGDIIGKFEDAWNGRVFSYSVQKNRIGYKPALTLDRADNAIAAKLFDIFSSGYTSLRDRQDAIKNGKKPRCTAVSYSCGKICLSLQNTCWINSAGQKVKKAGGAVASISQGRIEKLRTLAKYLAANGNNKWSKHGRAETLAAKANNLEAKRTNLFAKNAKTQKVSTTKKEPEFEFPPYDRKTESIPTQYKLIGQGEFGKVYLDTQNTNRVLKYDKDTNSAMTVNAAKAMGDLGIAPKLYGSIFEKGRVNAISMEYLDGYKTFNEIDSIKTNLASDLVKEKKESITKNLIKAIKIASDNGFRHEDLHECNVMFHPETLDVKFIDIRDYSIKAHSYNSVARQLYQSLFGFSSPVKELESYAQKTMSKRDYKEFTKINKEMNFSFASRFNALTEEQYKNMIDRTCELLGIN